jgi:hypothetical protein
MPPKKPDVRCPKCLGPLWKDGRIAGFQFYECKDPKCKAHCTKPVNVDQADAVGVDKAASAALFKRIKGNKEKVKRYIITAAQNATDVFKPYFQNLQAYARLNNAQLIVIPYRYRNPTSMWSEKSKDDDWWAPETAKYQLDKRVNLNSRLVLLADIKTQPTAGRPLQGYETLTGARSAIIGHPKLELTTVATPQSKLPKILTTTGSCTLTNYTPTKIGKKAEHHHTFGACVVEVKGDVFHMRQINAMKDGSFMDLMWEYRDGKRTRVERLESLTMGDIHEEFVDPNVVKATFGKVDSIVATLRPKVLVWHDLHDFYSRNHHHRGEVFINYVKHHTGADNVERALDKTFKFVDDHTPPDTLNVFVPSNHPDALARWVKESDPRQDPENAVFWARTFEAMCVNARMTDTGARTLDPFAYWGMKKLKTAGQARFLKQDESFLSLGVELGMHGHQGLNGARGSRGSFGRIGVKSNIGHSHSPGIQDGVYQSGMSARFRMEYVKGPSSHLQTHIAQYANGKRTLITIIGSEWRA